MTEADFFYCGNKVKTAKTKPRSSRKLLFCGTGNMMWGNDVQAVVV